MWKLGEPGSVPAPFCGTLGKFNFSVEPSAVGEKHKRRVQHVLNSSNSSTVSTLYGFYLLSFEPHRRFDKAVLEDGQSRGCVSSPTFRLQQVDVRVKRLDFLASDDTKLPARVKTTHWSRDPKPAVVNEPRSRHVASRSLQVGKSLENTIFTYFYTDYGILTHQTAHIPAFQQLLWQ